MISAEVGASPTYPLSRKKFKLAAADIKPLKLGPRVEDKWRPVKDESARLNQVRKLALALPEAVEQDHFGRPSFRVRGRIFATLPDSEHLNVMIDAFDVDGVVRKYPAA